MPSQINYKGRCGNKIFQYVTARIFSEKNELNLLTKLDCDIVKTKQHKIFDDDTNGGKIVMNNSSFVSDELNFYGKNSEYIFDDYFQNCVYINNNQELVMSFFDLPKFDKNTEDIVLNVRLDDKVHSNNLENPENWDNAEIIHPDYYKKILNSEKFNKVYIVVDEIKYEWEKKYISHFENYNPILVSKTPSEDFNFIRSFNKIITSVSTFSYWAAFLSDADKIYTFKNAGYLGRNIRSHGDHVKELWNIKNQSVVIDEKLYFGE
jgi:hypothetical protein